MEILWLLLSIILAGVLIGLSFLVLMARFAANAFHPLPHEDRDDDSA